MDSKEIHKDALAETLVVPSSPQSFLPLIKNFWSKIGLFIPLLLMIVELISWRYPAFGMIGNYLWILSLLFPIAFLMRELSRLIGGVFHCKTVFSLITIIVLSGIYLQRSNSIDTSRTAAWEINCALTQVDVEADSGFHQTCNYGNPNRQFLLPALPSLIFGRTPLALAVGYSSYFILGILAFASGALRYLGGGIKSDLVVAMSLLLLFHLPEFWRLTCEYEQVNFPLCFALIVAGFFLHGAASRTLSTLSNLGIVIIHSGFAYHPTVALFLGSMVAFAYLVFWNRPVGNPCKKYALQFFICAMVLFLSSLAFRSLQITNHHPVGASFGQRIQSFLELFFWQNTSIVLLSPLFHQLFLFLTLMGIFYVLGIRGLAISCWVIATFLFSVFSKGNWDYEVMNVTRVDRANVTIPVVLSSMLMYLKHIDYQRYSVKPFVAAFLLVLCGGVSFYHRAECKNCNWDGRAMQTLGAMIDEDQRFTLYLERNLPNWSFEQLNYYFPAAKQVLLNEDCSFQENEDPMLFLISPQGGCSRLRISYPKSNITPVTLSEKQYLFLLPPQEE